LERTLLMVKPDGTERHLTGKILARLEESGFRLLGLKLVKISPERARRFYAVHEGRPFLDELVAFMSSGPVAVVALQKQNAIADLRALVGATDPAQAACGTIRADWGLDKGKNTVHASDSVDNGKTEIAFHFKDEELVG
jgi:nucleoside-diphosphate kinase